MLQAYQILNLAKPYTDNQLIKQAEIVKDKPKLAHGLGFWSNRFVALREDLPNKLPEDAELLDIPQSFVDGIKSEVEHFNLAVSPVEIRPLSDGKKVVVRMQNCTSAGWVDAQYIAAVFKRYPGCTVQAKTRKGKRYLTQPEKELTWKAFNGGVVAIVDNEIVAIVMGMNLKDKDLSDCEWSLRVED